MKKREALKAWGEITEIDCFNNDDEFTIIPFHEYILKLNKV